MSDSPAYFNGDFLPLAQVRVSPLDRGFLFGDGVYEVIPVYGRRFLDLNGHLNRLANSLNGILLHNPHTHSQWRAILQRLVDTESATDKKIYVQVTRGVQTSRSHDFVGGERATVFAMCSPQAPPGADVLETGIRVYTQEEIRWSHCHLKTISLLPNVLLKHAAWRRGGAEALIVKHGRVIEGSSSNVFAVIDGQLHTPAKSSEILPGITRDLLIGIATEAGLRVMQCELSLAGLLGAEEVWISSSTRGVAAVTRVDDIPIGNGVPGPIWRDIYRRYQRMLDALRND